MGIQVEDSMNPAEPEQVKDDAVEAGGQSQAPPHADRRVDINFPHELSERVAEDENYPSKPSKKRYDTTFQSLAESLEGSSDIDRHPSQSLVGKSTKPDVVWLEGVLDCFNASFPYDADDQRRLGFVVGQQIVGLYLAEMLLKYALDHFWCFVRPTPQPAPPRSQRQRWTWATVAHAHSAQVGSGDRRVREPSPTKNTRQPKGPFLLCVDG